MDRRDVHGHIVYYEDEGNTKYGVNYLDYDLQHDEAEVMFKQAKLRGEAEFEDSQDREFTLFYDRGRGTYRVEPRGNDNGGGGFFL